MQALYFGSITNAIRSSGMNDVVKFELNASELRETDGSATNKIKS